MVWWIVVASAVFFGFFGLSYLYGRREARALPPDVVAEIVALPTTRGHHHLVDLELSDGRVIHRVWVAWNKYPTLSFRGLFERYDVKSVVHARASHNEARRDPP